MTTEFVFAAIFMGPILLGCFIWGLAVFNWPGFGRLGCRMGRHKAPKELELRAYRTGHVFVGECPRCGALITRTVEGEWLEIL